MLAQTIGCYEQHTHCSFVQDITKRKEQVKYLKKYSQDQKVKKYTSNIL